MIGRKIQHYEIVAKIGEGGMGVVYKAHDSKLDRFVALKFLPREMSADPDVRRRFMHEARAASALDHTHIATVHEIGETDDGLLYIAMPYYEGESLQQRLAGGALPVNEALRIAVEIGRGLARAHDEGVVHRDVKPGNIMLCAGGESKIMDFGLAKIAGASRVTRTGQTVGTISYMSPEQTRGRDADHRTDVWALGAVLYEMLAGSPPFEAEHQPATIYLILNTDPEPLASARPELPLEVEQVVSKALEKDPDRRYQTTAEFVEALEDLRERFDLLPKRSAIQKRIIRHRRRMALTAVASVAAAALIALAVWYLWPGRAEALDSIAVLPIENLSGDEKHDLDADGVTGELISNFNRIGALEKVSSRRAVIRYKGSDKSVREIAEELGVKVILSGTLQIQDDRVRIYIELIDGDSEEQIWSHTFPGRKHDILTLQGEIARASAAEIEVSLTPEEEEILTVDRTVNDPAAWEAYLLGVELDGIWSGERRRGAKEKFEQAIALDSTFAPAYARLAYSNATGDIGGTKDLEKAYTLATRALELDPSSPLAHEAMGHTLLNRDYDWEGAEREFEESRRLAPGDAGIGMEMFYSLSGRPDVAVDVAQRALEQEPRDFVWYVALGYQLMAAHRPDESIAVHKKILTRFGEDEQYWAWEWIAYCYTQKGLPDSAFAIARRENIDTSSWHLWDWVYSAAGMPDSALRHIDQMVASYQAGDGNPTKIGMIYGFAGRRDEAFEWLNRAVDERHGWTLVLNNASAFGVCDSLITDPRWDDLVERIGFPEGNWKRRPIWKEWTGQ